MSQQFPGVRSPQGTSQPFYNPQKNVVSPTNPSLYPKPDSTGGFGTSAAKSKSFITRSTIYDVPKGNNSSGYVKSTTEMPPPPPGSFSSTNVSSPTSTFSSYPGFTPPFPSKSSTEMGKSAFHDNLKSSDIAYQTNTPERTGYLNNTPGRRAPRMSEHLPFEPPSLPPKSLMSNSDPNHSPEIQKKFKDPKQFENHFLKNKHGSSNVIQPEKPSGKFEGSQASTGRAQIWVKSSLGKRKGLCLGDFKKIKELGSGKYGQVSLVRERNTGFTCALKMIQKKLLIEQEITEQFIRELKIQQFLNHPNIIKMYGYFADENYIYIILEVGTGGQLYHQLKRSEPMPEPKISHIMEQVCKAVNEIHSLRIIHRDIKPENIVLHDNVVKLCDFGWSVYLDNKLRSTFCGTPLYVCPEILKGKEYDEKIDIWSLGIMMYEMAVGENPFKITKEEELIKIVKDEISIPSYVFVSRQARDFLDKCLKKNPADRVGIKELLNHEFILKHQEKDKKMNF